MSKLYVVGEPLAFEVHQSCSNCDGDICFYDKNNTNADNHPINERCPHCGMNWISGIDEDTNTVVRTFSFTSIESE